MHSEVRTYLRGIGLPDEDDYARSTSTERFSDGSHYKIEVLPTEVAEYEQFLELADGHPIPINKFVDVTGTVFDTDAEIREKCRLCRAHGVQLLMEPGTGHGGGDVSQQMALGEIPVGTVRGVDALVDTLAEAKRAAALGVRGFNIQDEGVLRLCQRMRADGELPSDTVLKVSSSFSVANPASCSFWADDLGPYDSINPVRDLTLPMMAALRDATAQPLDLHAFWYTDVARTRETPEMVRIAAPVSLKNYRVGDRGAEEFSVTEQYKQSRRVVETIEREYPAAVQAEPSKETPGVPAPPDDR